MNFFSFIFFLFFFHISLNVHAGKGSVTGLEIPRFVSLKSNDVNLRIGPSKNYPILIKYTEKNLPIEIIEEFDVWRKTRDFENNEGWIHKSLIKGDRYVIINNKSVINENIFNRPNGQAIAMIGQKNIIKLDKCLLDWCHVYHKKIKGWKYHKKMISNIFLN